MREIDTRVISWFRDVGKGTDRCILTCWSVTVSVFFGCALVVLVSPVAQKAGVFVNSFPSVNYFVNCFPSVTYFVLSSSVVFVCVVFNACNSACVSKYTAGLKPGKRRRGCKLFGLVLGKVMIIACCLIWDIFQQRFVTCADVVALLKDIKIFPVCVLKRSS